MDRRDPGLSHADVVRARALRASTHAYERGRVVHALCCSWPALLIATLSAWLARNAALAVALVVVTVAFHVVGRGLARGVWPGLVAGAVPLIAGAVWGLREHCPLGGGCASYCMLVCGVAGLVAGAAVGLACRKEPSQACAALTIAALVGAVGCVSIGFAAVFGMATALALAGAVPVVVMRARAA